MRILCINIYAFYAHDLMREEIAMKQKDLTKLLLQAGFVFYDMGQITIDTNAVMLLSRSPDTNK